MIMTAKLLELYEEDPAKLLEYYEEEGFNITPPIKFRGLSDYLKADIDTVLISTNLDDKDVYPHSDSAKTKPEDRRFRLSKQALDKLAFAASVKWHEQFGSKRLDDTKNRDYVAFKSYAGVRKANDSWVAVSAYYDLDLISIREGMEEQFRAKGVKYKKQGAELEEYVKFCVTRDMRKKYLHRSTLCESGASTRVLRKLLGIKGSYTFKELQRPFVCPSVIEKVDYEDPNVKIMIAQERIGAQSKIYGLPSPVERPEAKDVISEDIKANGDDDIPLEDISTEPDEIDVEPEVEDDFDNWDRASREEYLIKLCKAKKYALTGLIKRMKGINTLSDVPDVQLSAMKDKFSQMPDVPDDDDIPY